MYFQSELKTMWILIRWLHQKVSEFVLFIFFRKMVTMHRKLLEKLENAQFCAIVYMYKQSHMQLLVNRDCFAVGPRLVVKLSQFTSNCSVIMCIFTITIHNFHTKDPFSRFLCVFSANKSFFTGKKIKAILVRFKLPSYMLRGLRLTLYTSGTILGRIVHSVKCLTADTCLTADPGVASSIAAWSHNFMEIDHEIISYGHSHPFR